MHDARSAFLEGLAGFALSAMPQAEAIIYYCYSTGHRLLPQVDDSLTNPRTLTLRRQY
jgi:hypothetical protein